MVATDCDLAFKSTFFSSLFNVLPTPLFAYTSGHVYQLHRYVIYRPLHHANLLPTFMLSEYVRDHVFCIYRDMNTDIYVHIYVVAITFIVTR